MNGAMEDLLREGLDRLTADVQVPTGCDRQGTVTPAAEEDRRLGPRWPSGQPR